jgi:hypothetical protein
VTYGTADLHLFCAWTVRAAWLIHSYTPGEVSNRTSSCFLLARPTYQGMDITLYGPTWTTKGKYKLVWTGHSLGSGTVGHVSHLLTKFVFWNVMSGTLSCSWRQWIPATRLHDVTSQKIALCMPSAMKSDLPQLTGWWQSRGRKFCCYFPRHCCSDPKSLCYIDRSHKFV